MLITRHRVIAAAAAVAIALTSLATPASARPYYRGHGGAGGAAMLGAVAVVFGTIAVIAAQRQAERRYRNGYGYGYGPQYAPPPAPGYGYYGGYRPY